MDNILSILSSFDSEHEKALMQGIYNAVALSILCVIFAASFALYIILSPFVKPLIWALLCGAALFPFKLSLSTMMQSWFVEVENSNKPLLMHLLIMPIEVVDHFANTLGKLSSKCNWEQLKLVLVVTLVSFLSYLVYAYSPGILFSLVWILLSAISTVIAFFISLCSFSVVSTIVMGYILAVIFYWTPEYSIHFQIASYAIWSIISLFVSSFFGSYSVATFCLIQCLFFIGTIYEAILYLDHSEINQTSTANIIRNVVFKYDTTSATDKAQEDLKSVEELKLDEELKPITESKEAPPLIRQSSTDSKVSATKPKPKLLKSVTFGENSEKWFPRRYSEISNPNNKFIFKNQNFLRRLGFDFRTTLDVVDDKIDTYNYLYGMIYFCAGMILWKNKWLVPILMVPIAYHLVKVAGSYFGLWTIIRKHYEYVILKVIEWCTARNQALLPVKVRGLYKVANIVNEKFTNVLKGSIDAVSTIAVILGLLVFLSCASVFITFQVYGEGLHLLQVAGQLLNSTVMNNPDIDWIPQNWEESINNVLDDAYTHGRDFIRNGMKGLTKDFEPTKAEHLEKKILELWDRLYQAWMMSNEKPEFIGPTVDSTAAYSVWESIKDSYEKIPTNFFNMANIKIFVQENIGILTSILDSMWSIIKGNASIILSIFTESLYLVLMSGSLVFNFILSMVVFFSALFYLLSSSQKTYKPVELITLYSPISCHRFAIALQEVIIGVFTVTFKLASFFGMWTWFVHNLFQVKVTYLPAVFAALLAAVPFLDPYFACIPATIELWITRGPMIALIFFVCHFLASNIIVTDFYKEIKGGGHPYLTGLSIAGGTFCLGVEGAIFGPLLLCCIIVAINLGRRYLYTPTTEETINSLKKLNQLSSK